MRDSISDPTSQSLWLACQASTRDLGETLQVQVSLVLITFVSSCLALVADAQRDENTLVLAPLVPCGIVLIPIVRMILMISLVTEKCSKVCQDKKS